VAAPSRVRALSKASRLTLVCATAAFLFVLAACGRSPNKQGPGVPSNQSGSSTTTAAPAESASSTPPTAPAASSGAPPPSASTSPSQSGSTEAEDSVDIGSITIEANDDANNGSPVAVDLVLVYDASLIPQIESQSAKAWFKGKAALTSNAGDSFSVMSWTVPPGDDVPETPIDARPGALAAFVFANYASKGDHRLRIDGSGTLTVTLEASDPSYDVDQ